METVGTSQNFGYPGQFHDQQAPLGSKDQNKGEAMKVGLRGGCSCAQNEIYQRPLGSHRDITLVRAKCSHYGVKHGNLVRLLRVGFDRFQEGKEGRIVGI